MKQSAGILISQALTDERTAFIAHFAEQPGKEAQLLQRMIARIRAGMNDPRLICRELFLRYRAELQNFAAHNAWMDTEQQTQERARIAFILQTLRNYPDEAIECASYYIAYEALPRLEREHMKEQSKRKYQDAWMDKQPPSTPQLNLLRHLGYRGEVQSKLEATRLINQLKGIEDLQDEAFRPKRKVEGERIALEDLHDYKLKHGLEVTRIEWPDDVQTPIAYMEPAA